MAGDYELQLVDRVGLSCGFGRPLTQAHSQCSGVSTTTVAGSTEPAPAPPLADDEEAGEPGFIVSDYPLLLLQCEIKLTRLTVEGAEDALWASLLGEEEEEED